MSHKIEVAADIGARLGLLGIVTAGLSVCTWNTSAMLGSVKDNEKHCVGEEEDP